METVIEYVDESGNPTSPPSGMANSNPRMNYPPATIRGEKADLLDKIKPDLIVEVIRHKLMGEEFLNGKWVQNIRLKNRAISEVGAWDIANLMLGVSSQNVSLSKLKDHEIRERTFNICRTAQHLLIKNWKEYGITGTDQLDFIHQIIFSNTFITLKQPEGGGIRDLLKGTTQEQRSVVTSEERRGGLFRRRR